VFGTVGETPFKIPDGVMRKLHRFVVYRSDRAV
jgi:hypothetical protein